MDDPLFDPWGLDEDLPSAEAREAPRWRSPERAGPTVPKPAPEPRARPEPETARTRPLQTSAPSAPIRRSRLPGTPGFLRTMAAPRLLDAAQRLTAARHQAWVEDLLDASPHLLRLTLRPWRGPMAGVASSEGRLEIAVAPQDEAQIVLRWRLGDGTERTTLEERLPTAKLTASWLEARLVAFVSRVLDEA